MTRRGLLRRGAGFIGASALGGAWVLPGSAFGAVPLIESLVIGKDELTRVRQNIFEDRYPFAERAWAITLGRANAWIGYEPKPTRPDSDLSDWFRSIYHPGLLDGEAAFTLGAAHTIGGSQVHAQAARRICLAWARTYNPLPPPIKIGHMVAESVGPVIKLCMAFDLVRGTFSASERAEFGAWARQFVERGKANADYARDSPWWPETDHPTDRASSASYGNSANWQRAMAVWAAAAVSPALLRQTLDWNLAHTTPKGNDYGWDNLLEGLIVDGTGGQVSEDRYRRSVHYGAFTWTPLVLIADLARRAGHRRDLFAYRTKAHGYSIFSPLPYYAPFFTSQTIDPRREQTNYGGSEWPADAARWRGMAEILYRNATDPATVKALSRVVNYGGPETRAGNYNIYLGGHGAVFGRGPRGPRPRVS